MRTDPSELIKYKNYKVEIINFLTHNKNIIINLIFILLYLLLYLNVDSSTQSLISHDEGLYARRSRLLEDSNNWFSPPFLTPHHKTLGSYWFTALSIRIFGNSELSLRLPSIICSFFSLFISYFIALKVSDKKSALISIFALSSMPLWIKYSRYASPDIPFVLCILLVIFTFLKFLDSNLHSHKLFYIFISGLFLSSAFFLRSYMVFVPIIGLTPFIGLNLYRTTKLFRIIFFAGLLVGSFPTFLNLYYSYKKFGIIGISKLFYFAKSQAIGSFDFNNLILIPFNYLYYTFPIGLLFIILCLFTKSNNNLKYPLLTYWFPFISLTILLCMSSSYPHYFLVLLPFLSNLFAVNLQSYSYRLSTSKNIIRNLLAIIIGIIIFSLLFSLIYFKDILSMYSHSRNLLVYVISLLLIISFLSSLRHLFGNNQNHHNLKKFLYNIIIPQYIFISLLYNYGVIGNPNYKTKLFLNDKDITYIFDDNIIYLYKVNSKIETLLSYYLPSSRILQSLDDFSKVNYIITTDIDLINYDRFKSIKEFDNHYLLKNIIN